MNYHGHHKTVTALEAELPPVTLLLGPPSVGKWTLTEHLAEHHRVLTVDRSAHRDGLTADAARTVRTFCQRAPFGPLKLVTARLDRSSPAALGVLLKILEEPPAPVRFLLTADTWTGGSPLPGTITSRAVCHRLGLLADHQVTSILIEGGMNTLAAHKAAPLGAGQVKPARDALSFDETAKTAVLTMMAAVAAGDRDQLARTAKTADATVAHLLQVWLSEALTARWRTFTPPEAAYPRPWLLAGLAALRRLDRAGPRLAVHAALDAIITARS